MKRLISYFILALSLSATAPLALLISANNARANGELFYNYGDRKISLSVKTETIAVSLKPRRSGKTAMSMLEQDFGATPTKRGRAKSQFATKIQSVDNQKYALLSSSEGAEKLKEQAAGKSYISETLPVLKIAGKSNSLILPNEIIVGFKASVPASQREAILKQNNIASFKAIPFAPNLYLVTPNAKGLQVLSATNSLSKVQGIESAIPNFIEVKAAAADRIMDGDFGINSTDSTNTGTGGFNIKSQSRPAKKANTNDVATLQWHLNSQPLQQMMGISGARTDVRAPEVWSRGKKGDGVVVAVIDNLLQWDHPALAGKIVTIDCAKEEKKGVACLPGEVNGWDFSDLNNEIGDNDTRISSAEVSQLQPKLQQAMASDQFLQEKYAPGIAKFKAKNPNVTDAEILQQLRMMLMSDPVASFHGTMSAGMIAGNGEKGFRGIAPNAKILPVRAGGLGTSLKTLSIVRSILYSAVRGADVINMSFGSDVPNPVMAQIIREVQQAFPSIVFVGSAGNEKSPVVGFPSGFPGVISVGAINLKGNRAPYSNFGKGLDVVAPGGDTSYEGGVLTLSGVGADGFWSNSQVPSQPMSPFQDNRGYYVFTQGTSFSGPAVAGVVALMKSADPQRKLTGSQYRKIVIGTSSRAALSLIPEEAAAYQTAGLSGSADEFFFANGLVNAEKAVAAVEQAQQ
jgi:serine protease